MKYTIKNFIKDFSDDKTCLAFIFKTDWVGTVAVGGRKARAFLKENKDELQNN